MTDLTQVQGATALRQLADRYKNSVEPIQIEAVPERVKRLAAMIDIMDGEEPRLDKMDLIWDGYRDAGDYDIVDHVWGNETFLNFDHYQPDTSKEGVLAYLKGDPTSDNTLVLSNIPRNNVRGIEQHPHFSAEAEESIREVVAHYREQGRKVTLTGYSRGGYAAKYWGSKLGVDSEVLNAHVFPHNTFAESDARTTFHTIATDETSFKYNLPTDGGAMAKDTHYVYPSIKGVSDANLLKGDVWGNHRNAAFDTSVNPDFADMDTTPELERMYNMPRGSTIAPALSNAGNAVAALDVGVDVAEGKFASAGIKSAVLASYAFNPLAGQVAVGAMLEAQAASEFKEGETVTGARHLVEGAAMQASTLFGPEAMVATGVVAAGVETGVSAYDDFRKRRYGDASFETAETASLAVGMAFTPYTGGVSLLLGAGVAGGLGLANRLRHAVMGDDGEEQRPREAEGDNKQKSSKKRPRAEGDSSSARFIKTRTGGSLRRTGGSMRRTGGL